MPRTARTKKVSQQDVLAQLSDALQRPRETRERYVGVRNISNDCIALPNPTPGLPPLLELHPEFVDPQDPTRFVSNPNAVQVVSHAVWMQLRRGSLYDKGMIIRDDSVLGETYAPAPPDAPTELAAGWAKNAVLDPVAFIERPEYELRAAIEVMTSEQSLRRLLTAVNQRIEKERMALQSNGDPTKEERALRNMPAIYHLAEELVLSRLATLGYR